MINITANLPITLLRDGAAVVAFLSTQPTPTYVPPVHAVLLPEARRGGPREAFNPKQFDL